jgi:hypothetical protein
MSRLSDRRWANFYPKCLENLAQCEELVESYPLAASPASLLSRLDVFAGMPAESRAKIEEALHAQFMAKYRIVDRLDGLRSACVEFRAVLEAIACSASEVERFGEIEALIAAGNRLREALDRLPKWIPPL